MEKTIYERLLAEMTSNELFANAHTDQGKQSSTSSPPEQNVLQDLEINTMSYRRENKRANLKAQNFARMSIRTFLKYH